jgi:iron-sulfur cluster assembly protein
MLALTTAAAGAIRELVADLPDGAGLRVALEKPGNGTEPAFAVYVVEEPSDGDEVVATQGASVFLEPAASGYFDDKVLDADGCVFTFTPA